VRLVHPWIRSPGFDGAFILAPSWLIAVAVLTLPALTRTGPMGTLPWLVLIVGLDVAHVYATLFRTYLDRRERRSHGPLLTLVPLFCWLAATLVHALSAALFWTVVAYTAVFHFIRQQYGLMMLYATPRDRESRARRYLDAALIGAATLYPILYWHTHLPRAFVWFIDGDFIALPAAVEPVARALYAAIAALYIVVHLVSAIRGEPVNVPRQLVVAGTALSWYVGIVAYDADLAFTATNVIAHAIPYLALIFVYAENREVLERPPRRVFVAAAVPLLFALLVGLAYVEEGLWDGFVWREHLSAFAPFAGLPVAEGAWRDLLVPLLILPQLTHYVLDGFIWRLRSDATWRSTMLLRRRAAPA